MPRKHIKSKRGALRARRAETLGFIVIALLIFLFSLARFFKQIHWSLR